MDNIALVATNIANKDVKLDRRVNYQKSDDYEDGYMLTLTCNNVVYNPNAYPEAAAADLQFDPTQQPT